MVGLSYRVNTVFYSCYALQIGPATRAVFLT